MARFHRGGAIHDAAVEHELPYLGQIHYPELGHLVEFQFADFVDEEDGVYYENIPTTHRGAVIEYTGIGSTNTYELIDAPDWISIETDGLHVISDPDLGEHNFTLRIASSSHIVDQPIQIYVA